MGTATLTSQYKPGNQRAEVAVGNCRHRITDSVVAVGTVANWSGDSVDPKTVYAFMSRPRMALSSFVSRWPKTTYAKSLM